MRRQSIAVATDLIKVNASDAFYFITCLLQLIIYDFIHGPWQISSLLQFTFQHIISLSAHSSIQSLHQSAASTESYTLSWSVMDASLIAVFRVYHQGALYASTFFTHHTVAGLAPCQNYEAKVEAVCGESIVMNVKALQTHTGVYRCA